MSDESGLYLVEAEQKVVHLCLANFERLLHRMYDGDLSLSEFEDLSESIQYQFDSLPFPLRHELLRRLHELSQELEFDPAS